MAIKSRRAVHHLKLDKVADKRDVEELGRHLEDKLKQIRAVNSRCKIYVCNVLPSKRRSLTLKAFDFSDVLGDIIRRSKNCFLIQGWDKFLGDNMLLSESLARNVDRNGKPDVLHLGRSGTKLLARIIKRSVLPRVDTNSKNEKRRSQATTPPADSVPGQPPREDAQV